MRATTRPLRTAGRRSRAPQSAIEAAFDADVRRAEMAFQMLVGSVPECGYTQAIILFPGKVEATLIGGMKYRVKVLLFDDRNGKEWVAELVLRLFRTHRGYPDDWFLGTVPRPQGVVQPIVDQLRDEVVRAQALTKDTHAAFWSARGHLKPGWAFTRDALRPVQLVQLVDGRVAVFFRLAGERYAEGSGVWAVARLVDVTGDVPGKATATFCGVCSVPPCAAVLPCDGVKPLHETATGDRDECPAHAWLELPCAATDESGGDAAGGGGGAGVSHGDGAE